LGEVMTFGCVAHGLNLVTKDILALPTIKAFRDAHVAALVDLRRPKVLPRLQQHRKVATQNYGGVKLAHDEREHAPRELSLPGDTRWTTHWRSVRHTRENEQAIRLLLADPERTVKHLGIKPATLVRFCPMFCFVVLILFRGDYFARLVSAGVLSFCTHLVAFRGTRRPVVARVSLPAVHAVTNGVFISMDARVWLVAP
jgi:hypothetical protein